MGRTQLQDAVPMSLGGEFSAFAHTLREEDERLVNNAELLLETNLGATAIGTGLNNAGRLPAGRRAPPAPHHGRARRRLPEPP